MLHSIENPCRRAVERLIRANRIHGDAGIELMHKVAKIISHLHHTSPALRSCLCVYSERERGVVFYLLSSRARAINICPAWLMSDLSALPGINFSKQTAIDNRTIETYRTSLARKTWEYENLIKILNTDARGPSLRSSPLVLFASFGAVYVYMRLVLVSPAPRLFARDHWR